MLVLRSHHDSAAVTFIDLTTYSLQQIQYFGEPFFFLIRDGETLSDMKVRIQKRLQVPDEQFLNVLILDFVILSSTVDFKSFYISPQLSA